jgi:serine/threonine-protein kinase RsbT
MPAEAQVPIAHESDIVAARREGRAIAAQLGFSSGELALIATAISELARNIIIYAGSGEVLLGVTERSDGKRGIRITARDRGPGIANLDLALRDGYSTSKGLGLGLPGARRLMDEFAVETELGKGTTVTATKWAR